MNAEGFSYILSEEDTGTGAQNHKNSSATEWFVAFYKAQKVQPATELPHGFLAKDRSNHPDFERVPYAFPFRASNSDLVFISVHLNPGKSKSDTTRRSHEIDSIFNWIKSQNSSEKDYVILGDMNIESCEELDRILPSDYASLNYNCLPTNTNPNGPKPYDHVIYNIHESEKEIHKNSKLVIINLIENMKKSEQGPNSERPYTTYNHKEFRMKYSDHNPILFTIFTDFQDDD